MIFSSPIMIMQISIPKLLIEIARAGNNQCLEAGEKQRERVKKQKNGPNAHPQQKKRNKNKTRPKIQIVLGLSIIFNCSKSVFHYF